ncbi:MAG: PEP-CTERM sorting domain-containing protein [Alphaproteobacteria bacterium]|nr:PEP-CTERM sorting domain-containing protein [Alphaproteobacteria bacterium]
MTKTLSSLYLSAAAAIIVAMSAIPANADAFNSALVAAVDPFTSGAGSCGGGPFDCFNSSSNGLSVVTQSYSQNGPGFTNAAFAEANLYTATMKIRASGSSTNPDINPYAQSNATFGDGFTTTNLNGSPFSWTGTSATFNLNFGTNNLLNSSGDNSAAAFVILGINKKGSTNATTNWFTGTDTIEYFLYEFGPTTQDIYYTYQGHGTKLDIANSYTSVPNSIAANFTPGGNFDWVLLFGASGQAFGDSSYDFDLSHTLTLQYVAPPDTITTSDSGVFGTQAVQEVPEPLSLSLFSAGVAGAIMMRRRKTKTVLTLA